MARLWTSGFELQSATAGVEFTSGGTNCLIDTSIKHAGSASIHLNPTAGFRWFGQIFKSSTSSSKAYVRVFVYFSALPAAGNEVELIGLWDSAAVGRRAHIRLLNTGQCQLYAGATQIGANSGTLSTGTWYRIELECEGSGAADNDISARINGTQFASSATATVLNFDAAYFGSPNAASTYDIYWDDIAINDTTGSSQTGFPGDSTGVIYLRPNAAGDANSWLDTSNGAGTTSNYTLVDETTPNDATDMVQSTTLNAEDLYNMSASGIPSTSTINVVHVGGRFRNDVVDATIGFKFEIEKTGSGTISQSAEIVPNSTTWKTNGGTTAFGFPITLYTDPDGAAWTQTTIDSMQTGVKITTDGTNKVQVSSIYALVDYVGTSSSTSKAQMIII